MKDSFAGSIYDSLHLELPDGNLYFAPIINWENIEKKTADLSCL